MRQSILKLIAAAAALPVLALAASSALAASIVINNVDAPGIGFNDPTPVTPIGGNAGTTLGAQRLIVFETAAQIWGDTLVSDVQIVVQATFQPLNCTPTSGTLGAAGPLQIFAFGAPAPAGAVPDTWYHVALANSLAGIDLVPGGPDPGLQLPPFADDIIAFFNGAIGVDPNCLTGTDWYNGLDNNQAANEIDLLSVVLHELGHGLGFSEFAREADGSLFFGLPSIYARFMLDTAQGVIFADTTDAGRMAAQVAGENLVWAGPAVTAAATDFLGPRPTIRILRPKSLKGTISVQAASFGPPLRQNGGMTGKVVEVDDGTGVGSDGCEPIQNKLNGKIAFIDRGTCAFVTKALNAQAAGAKGVVIANNVPGGPAAVGGSSPFVTIPTVGITLDQGNAIRAELGGGVNLKLILDRNLLAGADDNGLVRLYAPNPVQPGSSKSHFDTSATPNLLMEPAINPDLESATTLDLTPILFQDIGWTLQ